MRFQRIIENEKYKKYLENIEQYERNRSYCKHVLAHSLDVARINYIMLLEDDLMIDKDIVYAAALLHDIGRNEAYSNNHNHGDISIRIAREILPVCGYNDLEIMAITEVIKNHSGALNIDTIEKLRKKKQLMLCEYFKIADQLSRNYFCFKAYHICKWTNDKKNTNISV